MLRQFIKWLKTSSPQPLVRSYLFLRRGIGIIGVALPIVLVIGKIILDRRLEVLDSISAYYYSVMGNVFVGSLWAIGIFLICYQYDHLDDIVSTVAGVCAIGVSLFPTTPDKATGQQMVIGILHGLFAGIFFGTLALMAIFLFTRKNPDPHKVTDRKRLRNKIYLICGITIVVCLVLLILIALVQNLFLSGKPLLQPLRPVLVLEWLATWAFGIAWFVKGETLGILKDKKEGSLNVQKS